MDREDGTADPFSLSLSNLIQFRLVKHTPVGEVPAQKFLFNVGVKLMLCAISSILHHHEG